MTQPKIVKESMAYFVVFNHMKEGRIQVNNAALKNQFKTKINTYTDIKNFEETLKKMGYLDVVITDWKELGMESNEALIKKK